MQDSLGHTESAPLRDGESRGGRSPQPRQLPLLIEYLDVVVVLIVAAPALLLGAPVLGYVIGAAGWLLQRVLAKTDRRFIRSRAPRAQLGFNLFEAFGRIWLLAGAIVIAGVAGSRADGLTAALVVFGAYSIAFAIRILSGFSAGSADHPPARPATVAKHSSQGTAG